MNIELNINGANKEWQYVNILRVYFVIDSFLFYGIYEPCFWNIHG